MTKLQNDTPLETLRIALATLDQVVMQDAGGLVEQIDACIELRVALLQYAEMLSASLIALLVSHDAGEKLPKN